MASNYNTRSLSCRGPLVHGRHAALVRERQDLKDIWSP